MKVNCVLEAKRSFIFKSVRCSNHFWPAHEQHCTFRGRVFPQLCCEQFAQLFLYTLVSEWVWRQGRISHGSSSRGFSRALKSFVDLIGTGVTKTVSDCVCVTNGCKGMFLTANSANCAVSLPPCTPLKWFMSTDHNNILTLRLINLEKSFQSVCLSDSSESVYRCCLPVEPLFCNMIHFSFCVAASFT